MLRNSEVDNAECSENKARTALNQDGPSALPESETHTVAMSSW